MTTVQPRGVSPVAAPTPLGAAAATGASDDAADGTLRVSLDWRRSLLVSAAACTTFGILETVKSWVLQRSQGTPKGWTYCLLEQMPWWALWFAATPLVLWFARSFRLDDVRRARSVAGHLVGAWAISIVHCWLAGLAYFWLPGSTPAASTPAGEAWWFVLRYVFTDLVTYAAAVAIYYAVEYHTGFRRSAVAAAEAEARAARLQLDAAVARMQALRAELNPHFLFNSLNAVAGLVRRDEPDAAVQMLARLGELLRTTLDREMPLEVPLSEELELLRQFVDIELVRFGDRLRVTWEIDGEARPALVPPLILQPLVENALRHGVSRRTGSALLRISARRAGGQLELCVRDTGDGLAANAGQPLREGIGLSNTRARLAELYGAGGGAQLELAEVPGGGVRARVLLPFHLRNHVHRADDERATVNG